jgi:alkaline phosphatase D
VAFPFVLGVTSGSPLPSSVVLWTRIAPEPLEGGGAGESLTEPVEDVVDREPLDSDVSSRRPRLVGL